MRCRSDRSHSVFLECADDTSFQQATNAVIDEYGKGGVWADSFGRQD
jgi:hypothetical protein